MTTTLRSEATQTVVVVNGVDQLAITQGGKITALNPQPATGNDLVPASQVLGVGQTWQDVTSSRVLGTPYINNTGRTIVVHGLCAINIANASLVLTVAGIALQGSTAGAVGHGSMVQGLVPNGATYMLAVNSGVGSSLTVRELR